MDVNPLGLVPMLFENEALIALLVFAGTAVVVALWMPGFLLPIAASSGAMLSLWLAAAAVACGALVGSMAVFAMSRYFLSDHVPFRIARFLKRFEARFGAHGAWFVLVLRLGGAPHALVSASSALMPIRASSFAMATLVGMSPAIILAAATGAAIAG
jgi:uncharacterized membrane protein YdjX (TVP38/TMEM64 family)